MPRIVRRKISNFRTLVIDVVLRRYNQTIKVAGFDLLGIHDPVRHTPPIQRLRFEVGAAFRHHSKRTRALTDCLARHSFNMGQQ